MEAVFAIVVGIFLAAAIYLLLSKHSLRILLGFAVLSNGVNLLLLTAGRLTREVPPIVGQGLEGLPSSAANPLPQALILTAIVISFSFFAFLLVLVWRTFEALETDSTDAMRAAEPKGEPMPPQGY